ncbi:GT4 family glycosyltransferase PelF [Ectothiorhodospiraceae bacterium WFHF3C12]|nr:GT4 family glycosyltransferase PelF [Ectothiorhodospiraceae bacterium WFHF3C12]
MSAPVDVTLLLEGTYPYVRGGVSSWVHQLVSALPQYRFGLLFMGSRRKDYGQAQYALPDNVAFLREIYLMDLGRRHKPRPRRGNTAAFEASARLHEYFRGDQQAPDALLERVFGDLGRRQGITREDFLHSEAAWQQVADAYMDHCTDPSFVDYFWTVRNMHAPLFAISREARDLPETRAVHAISTGYAGLLGAMLSRQRGVPFVLTEHGIYTKERRIDLTQATWIQEPEHTVGGSLVEDVSYIRRLWIRFFEVLGRIAYQSAEPIVTLYEGNRQRQIRDGAPAPRTRVIPNGIPVERYETAYRIRPGADATPPVLGLVGRVVPIKDIKTFIRALRTVCNEIPEAEGWIIGPEEEDADYAAECRSLVESLGLEGRVRFLGFREVPEILPHLGLMVLTSISEAHPLVVLEAFAGGVPVVATDVGACRELVQGGDEADRALGDAGEVTPIADPAATAQACLRLLRDPQRWREAAASARTRVLRYYTEQRMFDAYTRIYEEASGG